MYIPIVIGTSDKETADISVYTLGPFLMVHTSHLTIFLDNIDPN